MNEWKGKGLFFHLSTQNIFINIKEYVYTYMYT